ncbi:hypothetical protein P7K49_028845, partial [Saguinus oedipus]
GAFRSSFGTRQKSRKNTCPEAIDPLAHPDPVSGVSLPPGTVCSLEEAGDYLE